MGYFFLPTYLYILHVQCALMALIWMNFPRKIRAKQESGIFELFKPLVAVEKQITLMKFLWAKA